MKGQTNHPILGNRLQRTLRRNMTDAERKLWRHLRNGQMGIKFRRQHPFGDYVLAFVSLDAKRVIEVDGGQHAMQTEADEARSDFLQNAGFREMRFWNHEVLQNTEAVKTAIYEALQTYPHPNPPLQGGGREGDGVCGQCSSTIAGYSGPCRASRIDCPADE